MFKRKTPGEGDELVNCVGSSITTPIVKTKYCYLAKPFYYPGSSIGRYSLTCLFDETKKEDAEFLKTIEDIATANEVDMIGYLDGKLISIKFQTKDKIGLFCLAKGKKKPKEIKLDHDLKEGYLVTVTFDLNTYYNKKTGKNGFNFCPKKIIFHVDDEETIFNEASNDRISKGSRDRSKFAGNGLRDPKL